MIVLLTSCLAFCFPSFMYYFFSSFLTPLYFSPSSILLYFFSPSLLTLSLKLSCGLSMRRWHISECCNPNGVKGLWKDVPQRLCMCVVRRACNSNRTSKSFREGRKWWEDILVCSGTQIGWGVTCAEGMGAVTLGNWLHKVDINLIVSIHYG